MVDSEPTTECDFLDLDIFLDPCDLNSDMNRNTSEIPPSAYRSLFRDDISLKANAKY